MPSRKRRIEDHREEEGAVPDPQKPDDPRPSSSHPADFTPDIASLAKKADDIPWPAVYIFIVVVVSFVVTVVLSAYARGLHGAAAASQRSSCYSHGCVAVAEEYLKMLNATIFPCEDFYVHACEGWISKHSDAESYERYLDEKWLEDLNTTVYNAATQDGSSRNMGTFYKSCYDFHKTENLPAKLVAKSLKLLRMNMTGLLAQDLLSLFSSVVRMSIARGVDTIFVFTAIKQNSGNTIQISLGESLQRKLGLRIEAMSYLKAAMQHVDQKLFNSSVIKKLVEYDNRVEDILRPAEKDDRGKLSIIRVKDLPEVKGKLSVADWLDSINSNLHSSWKLSQRDHVLVSGLPKVQALTNEFFRKEPVLVALYVAVQALTTLLQFDFNKKNQHHFTCLLCAYRNFPGAFSNLAADSVGSKKMHQRFRALLNKIREKVVGDIASIRWMTNDIKRMAVSKLKAVHFTILERRMWFIHPRAPSMTSDFLSNYVAIVEFNRGESVRYPMPVSGASESLIALNQSTRYWPDMNTVTVAPTMMRAPVYVDDHEEDFFNYATAGARVAALLYQAVSESGSRSDSYGREVTWWSDNVREAYNRSFGCYVEGYLRRVSINDDIGIPLRDTLFSTARGLATAIGLARLRDNTAGRLFFGRFCQQMCRANYFDEPVPLAAKHLCEFALVTQPSFSRQHSCSSQSRLGGFRRCGMV